MALTTLLMVHLARTVYSDTPDHDPAELLDRDRFPDRAAVEDHLLGSYIAVLYRRPSHIDRPWDAGDARWWLAAIARHLRRVGGTDMAWWQLRDGLPRALRVTAVVAVTAVPALAGGCVAGEPGVGAVMAVYLSLVLGPATGGARRGPRPTYGRDLSRSWRRMAAPLLSKSMIIVLMLVAVVAVDGSFSDLARAVRLAGTFAVLAGLAVAIAAGPAFAEAPISTATAISPAETLRLDRRNCLRKSLLIGLTGAALGSAFGSLTGWNNALLIAALYGCGLAFVFGVVATAWGQWLIARLCRPG